MTELKQKFLLEQPVVLEIQNAFVLLNGNLDQILGFFDKLQADFLQTPPLTANVQQLKAKIDTIDDDLSVKGENQISIFLRKLYRLNKMEIRLIIQDLWKKQGDVNKIHLNKEFLKGLCDFNYDTVKFTNFDEKNCSLESNEDSQMDQSGQSFRSQQKNPNWERKDRNPNYS